MNSIKRMYVSLKSQIDLVANEFENHEALAGVAIKELESAGSKTRVYLHKVKAMVDQQELTATELKNQAKLWSERAVAVRDSDEQRALHCVKRLRSTRSQVAQVEKQLQESRNLEAKVQSDLSRIQDQLQTVKRQKEMLSARQNRTRVNSLLESNAVNPAVEVKEIFERWENRVVGEEFHCADLTDVEDDFVRSFEEQEEDEELQAMLDELVADSAGDPINQKDKEQNDE